MKTTETIRDQRIKAIIDNFSAMSGTRFVGIRDYKSVKSGEVCDHVVNANFRYGKAIETTVKTLNLLTDSDFDAITKKYGVTNHEGEKYGSNAGARKYLSEGKRPKEGTKARIAVMNGVKETKLLKTVRNEIIEAFKANSDDTTRSVQSQAQIDAYTRVTNGVKQCNKTERYHIWAMAHWKGQPTVKGEYKDSTPTIEGAQKIAIERYCKNKYGIHAMPTMKYRSFVVEEGQLAEVNSTGETFTFI